MKKIYSTILSIAALFTFAFTVSAQEPGPYSIAKQITDPKNGNKPPVFPEETNKPIYVDTDNKIAFTKNISTPFKDGTYWIKLESFATGTASYKTSNAPADVVLVLDMSSSMNSYTYTTGSDGVMYEPLNGNARGQVDGVQRNASYSYQLINGYTGNNQRYIYFHGEYQPVYAARSSSTGGYYYLYFNANGQTYYLDGTQITTVCPTKYTGNSNPIWEGTLFIKRTSATVTRLRALKEAVAEFIEVIYHNDVYADDGYVNKRGAKLGNRISIVVYSTYENQDSDNVTKVLVDWTDVSNASGDRNETILKALAAETYHTGTASDDGMYHANAQLRKITPARREEASQTLVMFSDGSPHSQTWSDSSSGPYADLCIEAADTTKNVYGTSVFSVLLYTGTPPTNLTNYMQGISSNYPNAKTYTNLGARCDDEEVYGANATDAIYYHNAGDDLSGVFKLIAKQSAGNSNASLSAATSTVDIVSDSFVLPAGVFVEGADIKNFVKVFTAKLDEIDEDGDYVFEEEIMAPYSPDTFDVYENGVLVEAGVDVDGTTANPTISVALEGKNKIKVTGFDYANNWCGPITDENDQVIGHQGHKIIIMIPIKMNPDAVGGPDVSTNIVGSGIILPGQQNPLVQFESPTVSLPVNLYIEKVGLKPGESAKFKIERAEIPLDDDSWSLDDIKDEDWKYVTSIFVTQPEGADPTNKPMVKVRGMASVGKNSDNEEIGYIYKITEEDWSWSYQRDEEPQYTVTSKVSNPFTFTNNKIEELNYKLRHAESKATNIFKIEGGEERYDDSKKNERGTTDTENPEN